MYQIFGADVEATETDMVLSPTPEEVNGRLRLESKIAVKREGEKTRVEHKPRRCKDRRKFKSPILVMGS